MDAWRLGSEEYEDESCTGPCYCAIDLSSKSDLSGFVLYFPDSGRLVCRFFVCRAQAMADPSGHYGEWIEGGWLTVSGDERTDYDAIRAEIIACSDRWDFAHHPEHRAPMIAYDPWNAHHLSTQLEGDGFCMVTFGQGYKSMNEPSKEFEARIKEGRIRHNSPVLDWMAGNVSIQEDPAGNIKPVKPSKMSPLKIDGIVMAIMALGLSMMHDPAPKVTVYEERGVLGDDW